MATFLPNILHLGLVTDSLSSATTFTFTNPSGSAYFILEQNTGKDTNTGFFPEATTSYVTGTFSSLNNITTNDIVENRYKFGVVVPEGGGSFIFTPSDTSGGGSIIFRGTGTITLVTS